MAESIRPDNSWAAFEHALGEHGQQSLQRRGQEHNHAHDGQATSAGARPDEFQALADVVVDGDRLGARRGWSVRNSEQKGGQQRKERAGIESEGTRDTDLHQSAPPPTWDRRPWPY